MEREGGDKMTTPAPPTPPPGPWERDVRLPRSIVPSHYDLHLYVDPNKNVFSGHEIITIDLTEDNVKNILVHSSGLNITDASVSNKGNTPLFSIF